MQKQRGIGGLVIFIVVAVIAVLGGAVVYKMSSKTSLTTPQPAAEHITPAPTPTDIVANDTSDTGLANDSASVDVKLKAASDDSVNVDAGLNDQQGNLSEQ